MTQGPESNLEGSIQEARVVLKQIRTMAAKGAADNMARAVLAEVIGRIGRLPTAGELLTGFAQRGAQLSELQNALTIDRGAVYAREYMAFLRQHWTVERRAGISEPHQSLVDAVCALTEDEIRNRGVSGHPESRLEKALVRSETEADQEEYSQWVKSHHDWFKNVLKQKIANSFKLIIASRELPVWIKEEVQGAYGGVEVRVAELRGSIADAVREIKLPVNDIIVLEGKETFQGAVKLIGAYPEAEIRTPLEIEVERDIACFRRWRQKALSSGGRFMDDRDSCHLLTNGTLHAICEEWGMEPILRLLEEIGVAPDRDAEYVVRRGGALGYPAIYYVYSIEQEYCVLVAVHSIPLPYLDFVRVVRGGMEEVLAWLEERPAIDKKEEEAPRNALERIAGKELLANYLSMRREAAKQT